ncbi:small-conductance mechanosensitive channel [Rubidibacter lacunae KORDI 51-2]|uniref:Small-conductance mechanosensitive channel n=1 Tax=Rubidibacter lacunae KORDI 51-2 TaxID=582515 RepID=U5DSF5_9CHRO|nr:mechanosensitive ion channel domain-containing protein [Rubidibacter lacunae]ERN42600.1 small-conductance mechanosensitive channel [Rubidibacter lacunae KORDI 51-2]
MTVAIAAQLRSVARAAALTALAAALWCCTLVAIAAAPATAQTADPPNRAAVVLDGRALFYVSSSGRFTARERANDASRTLQRMTYSSDAAEVEVVTRNDLPVITVNGSHLLSVTPADTPAGRSLEEQADLWSEDIQESLQRAQAERSRTALTRALVQALLAMAIAAALSFGLGWIWHRWLLPAAREAAREASETPDDNRSLVTKEIATRIILNVLRGIVWLFAIAYISNLFPQTRLVSRLAIRHLVGSLISDLFPLGDKSYSVLDLTILLALFVGVFLLARLIRRLLRLRVLSIAGLSRPAQETIAAIANYAFLFIGSVVVLQLWGLDIGSLTVFAGVLGAGIGLGLQGIAKEFISGLVLIFERPIAIGDFVEVEDLKGIVERIGIRSTEIITIDRISVILPNSRFLDQNVTNWSHHNPISRLRVPLGIAYGSNMTAVRTALLEVAEEHTSVLSIPNPEVLFMGFGNSSLDLVLLVWIAEPQRQFQIKSDLYFRIDMLFRERDIEVPFPQHDLHLRSGTLPVDVVQPISNPLA